MTRLLILFTTITLLFMSAQATFAASVTITPVTAGSYSIQGNAMDGVAGIDLTILYDSSSLSSPSFSKGAFVGGALVAANTNNPGSIKIAIISTKAFSGSGQIATVTFATQSGTGGITSATVSMIDSKGAPVASQVVVSGGNATTATTPGFITSAGVPFSQPDATATTTTDTTVLSSTPAAQSSSIPTYLGTVSMPSDVQTKGDTKPVDTTADPVQVSEPMIPKPVEQPVEDKPLPEPQKPEKVTMTSYQGTLENFRTYQGEKSPANLIALFKKQIAPTIRQEPAVVLSDGKTPVKILVKLEGAGVKSPNFALNGAKLVSLNKDDASFTWIVEAMPQAGIVQAGLTILTDSTTLEYPLTLAPPVKGVSPAEADFVTFLKDSGAATPKRDLNGDGKHDYLDDFIYTAHYLIWKDAAGKSKK